MSETSSRHVKWGDWALDCGVFGQEGLCLVDGYFRGQRMFNKLSLPVIRVKYVIDEFYGGLSALQPYGLGCGPYNDQITWDPEDFGENLNPISGPHHLVKVICPGGNRYLCTEEITIAGVPHLRISVYARIGAYHIAQTWRLNNDGWVQPRISSKGLSCNLDHWHHPYWRFDFALGAPEVHRLAVHPWNGAKLADITQEGMILNSWFGRAIEYRITSTQPPDIGAIRTPAEAAIRPPIPDAAEGIVGPTVFSSVDGYVRRYRHEEDRNWPHKPEDEISFGVHESCVDTDIVFWSVCHLSHQAAEGKDHWHTVGPDIHFQPMVVANLPPESMRKVLVDGTMSVKDFGVFKDRWAHSTFSEQVLVNPNVRFQEVVKTLVQGDVTAELIIRLEWQRDMSVNVSTVANLFDEVERVARVEGSFNVRRDSSMSGAKVHLVDHHGGDPDTADMGFRVDNQQQ